MSNKDKLLVAGALIACFIGGGAVGAKLMEKKLIAEFDERLEKEMEDVRNFYGVVHKKQYPTPADAVNDLIIPEAAEALAAYKGRDAGGKIAYHKIVKTVETKSEETENEEVASPEIEVNVFDQHRKDRGEIYIITEEEYLQNDSNYVQSTVTFYKKDLVLTDEREEPIENYKSIIGEEAGESFGTNEDDPNVVHVRNKKLQIDFEVCLSEGSYAHEVLGADEEIETPRARMNRGG